MPDCAARRRKLRAARAQRLLSKGCDRHRGGRRQRELSISITTPGRPAEYTYQWYRNGAAVSGGTTASLTLTGLTAAATYSVYCKVTNKAGSVNSRAATLTVRSYLPAYTYTGSHQLIDDGNFNWRLKLLTSGTLTFSHLGSAGSRGAQAFLVGGGGAGAHHSGGGGGYTHTSPCQPRGRNGVQRRGRGGRNRRCRAACREAQAPRSA